VQRPALLWSSKKNGSVSDQHHSGEPGHAAEHKDMDDPRWNEHASASRFAFTQSKPVASSN